MTMVKEKKQIVQDHIPPLSIYINMCTLYTYTNTYMPKSSSSGFFGPSRSLATTPGLTSSTPCAAANFKMVYEEEIKTKIFGADTKRRNSSPEVTGEPVRKCVR